MKTLLQPHFLPMTMEEMRHLGWTALDVLLITGDAYIDHPAFGVSLLGRTLVAHGYRTGIISQPDWQNPQSLTCMGPPLLFTGVTAGALDSMLAHYTAFRKKRHDDAYTPGGKAGKRPNRACIVYANLARRAFPHTPVVLGGIEASLRRISHYDFWTDSLRRSVLVDAKADLLLYGMAETSIVQTAELCRLQKPLRDIPGTAWIDKYPPTTDVPSIVLPAHEDMLAAPHLLMQATLQLERHVHAHNAYAVQAVGDRHLVLAPPPSPPTTEAMDALYALPFARAAHPSYTENIPAETMLRTSITSHRGCGGGCSFCSLALHQGRHISSRSETSILDEVRAVAKKTRFSGSISDVGGPTANMWQAQCSLPEDKQPCKRASCCHPQVCRFFNASPQPHVTLLRKIRALPDIKHVRVASGIRPDIIGEVQDALYAYTVEFTGGQLKVAPEHSSPHVLELMRKPQLDVFERFLACFQQNNHRHGKEQFVVPYLMSAFPGCTDNDMRALASWLQERHWKPQQVQCFIPTPGTVATAMFYAAIDPKGTSIYVAKTDAERLRQHRILMPTSALPPHRKRNISDKKMRNHPAQTQRKRHA